MIREIKTIIIFQNSKNAEKFCEKFFMSSRSKHLVFATIAAAQDKFYAKNELFKELVKKFGGKVTIACDVNNLIHEYLK